MLGHSDARYAEAGRRLSLPPSRSGGTVAGAHTPVHIDAGPPRRRLPARHTEIGKATRRLGLKPGYLRLTSPSAPTA